MSPTSWTASDLEQMKSLSIAPSEVERQIAIFKSQPPYARLLRPAVLSDGIQRIQDSDKPALLARYEKARGPGRLSKFVPASGAATRMFQTILKFLKEDRSRRSDLEAKSGQGDPEALSLLRLMDSLPQVAFYADLRECLRAQGKDLEALLEKGEYGPVWEALLSEEGLGYGLTSKGLIQFHSHAAGSRTALEEHLRESVRYLKDAQGLCRIHFTVSPEHRASYEKRVRELTQTLGRETDTRFQIDFSEQEKSYQTIAVDLENEPFRDKDGKLVFRPAGHGALLKNLDGLGADIVFIKNIDNVVVEKLLEPTIEWKKLLAGYLLEAQQKVFEFLGRLEKGDLSEAELLHMADFVRRVLWVKIPGSFEKNGRVEKEKWFQKLLDRPMRVCGVVPNTGEPGGGPFWVDGADGNASLQIVEAAQVDSESPGQSAIFQKSTHFNPVDLVCAISDRQGKPYPLTPYIDEKAVFISRKSYQGRDLKALELPGLWNGAMAEWITLFIEVPLATFNPVKTVFDLLKPAHQA
jgi:Domain of unknown function (DUF4301)